MKLLETLGCKHALTIDYETYYDSEYSLTKMPIAQYVGDARFEVLMCGFKWDNEPAQVAQSILSGFGTYPEEFNFSETLVVGHNLAFDAYILENYFGMHGNYPKAYFCTYQAARPFFASKLKSLSLASLSEHFGIGQKGDAIINAKGKHREDFTAQEWSDFRDYCIQDVNLSYQLFLLLSHLYEKYCLDEVHLIDQTIKQFVRPQLRLDFAELDEALYMEQRKKRLLKEQIQASADELRSDEKFAQLLISRGLPESMVPKKRSTVTGKEKYAFAKTDKQFLDLRNDPEWEPYVNARLAFKSTLEESRLERLMDVHNATGGSLPVPVLYYGAHTGRFSGTDKINLQNMPRESAIRRAIIPPPGKKIIAADLAQIEARFTACLAGQNDLVQAFANDEDVYSDFASGIYNVPVNKEDYPRQRFVGKTGILSMQYQVGHTKFHSTMNNVYHTHMELDEAQRVVDAYRERYKNIVKLWKTLQGMVEFMADTPAGAFKTLGPVRFESQQVILPNGMPMYYRDLHFDHYTMQYIYKSTSGGTVSLYGGKLLENIVQACCRIILTTAQLRLAKHNKFAALSVHDELIYVAEEDNAPILSKVIQQVMEYPVEWMPDLPIKCEVEIGSNYSECK